MTRTFVITTWFCASLLTGTAHAESGWTDFAAIDELRATARHYYVVRLDATKNPSGCPDGRWFFQDYGAAGSNKMFLTLLEAVKAGIPVRIYVTGRCNLDGYSEFSAVSMGRSPRDSSTDSGE